MKKTLFILTFLLCTIAMNALDYVFLTSGEKVAGRITRETKSSVLLKTEAGVVIYKFSEIKEIQYESGMIKEFENGVSKSIEEDQVGKVVYFDKRQRWEFIDVKFEGEYTILRFNIKILSNFGGCFDAHNYDKRGSDIYIHGDMGKLKLTESRYTGNYSPWKPMPGYLRREYFWSFQKGKYATASLYFPRVPQGVQVIDLHFNGGLADPEGPGDVKTPVFDMRNILIENNGNTTIRSQWTEESLKQYWSENKICPMEGIYSFLRTSNKAYWGESRHRIAIKKENDGYHVIYLNGANNSIWSVGELKGTLSATKTRTIYKVDLWYLENKQVSPEDFYVKYYNNSITFFDIEGHVETDFLKVYPQEDVIEDTNVASGEHSQGNKTLKGNGSGFFVSSNIVATNFHVVKDATKIEVVIASGAEIQAYEANILCVDKINDLALIQIGDPRFIPYMSLPYSIAHKSSDVGISVFSMGYPYAKNGLGEEVKITDGIISSKTGFDGDVSRYQVSTPIQPGNSGGPLFDEQGNLIGMISSGVTELENVGYAIKSTYLHNLMDAAPVEIKSIDKQKIQNNNLPDLIKEYRPYVVLVLIY